MALEALLLVGIKRAVEVVVTTSIISWQLYSVVHETSLVK